MNNNARRQVIVATIMANAGRRKQASNWGGAVGDAAENIGGKALGAGKWLGNQATYFIPGVSTARYGMDAINDFSSGHWIKGIGDTIGAGVSLIPGVGGGVAGIGRMGMKGLSFLPKAFMGASRFAQPALKGMGAIGGTKALWGAGAKALEAGGQRLATQFPTFARGYNGLYNGLGTGEKMMERGFHGTMGKLPGVSAISSNPLVRGMRAHPLITGHIAGTAWGSGFPVPGVRQIATRAQSVADAGTAARQQTAQGGLSALSQIRLGGFGMANPAYMTPPGSTSLPGTSGSMYSSGY